MRPVHALGGDLEHVAFVAQVGRAAPQILVTIPRRLMIMAGGGDGPAFACLMAVRPHRLDAARNVHGPAIVAYCPLMGSIGLIPYRS